MRPRVQLAVVAAALVLAAAGARRADRDQDFEFDDDAEAGAAGAGAAHARRPRRFIYDPHNALCRALVCKKREVCVVRDAPQPHALCATKKDIARNGDVVVSAAEEGGARGDDDDDDDDVFYEGGGGGGGGGGARRDGCVGCGAGGGGRAQFVCGSDNRTYSSLCRLDLHNCVRRGARPVALACRGFCPCRAPPRPLPRPRPRARPRRPAARRRRPRPDPARNDVLPANAAHSRYSEGSEGCALDKMANRLLDWFSVLMEEAAATAPPPDGFPAGCKPEVRWMFDHLDTDGDGVLSPANLYALRHDERERCLRPFLGGCARGGGGGGGGVSRGAWCACLRRAARPCAALAAGAGAAGGGGYVPACDSAGRYRARQCHPALGVCWCVDPHGVERPGTRTKGALACPITGGAPADDEDEDADAEAEAEAEADGDAGSGDADLRF